MKKLRRFRRPRLSEDEKTHNRQFAAVKCRAKRKEDGFTSYQRYVPVELKDEIRQWVNARLKRFTETGA